MEADPLTLSLWGFVGLPSFWEMEFITRGTMQAEVSVSVLHRVVAFYEPKDTQSYHFVQGKTSDRVRTPPNGSVPREMSRMDGFWEFPGAICLGSTVSDQPLFLKV